MKRRDFLVASGAAAIAPIIPLPIAAKEAVIGPASTLSLNTSAIGVSGTISLQTVVGGVWKTIDSVPYTDFASFDAGDMVPNHEYRVTFTAT